MLEDKWLKEITFQRTGSWRRERAKAAPGRSAGPPEKASAPREMMRSGARRGIQWRAPPKLRRSSDGGRMIRPMHMISGFLVAVAVAAVAVTVTADSPT